MKQMKKLVVIFIVINEVKKKEHSDLLTDIKYLLQKKYEETKPDYLLKIYLEKEVNENELNKELNNKKSLILLKNYQNILNKNYVMTMFKMWKNTESIIPKILLQSKCAVCISKKSRLIKKQASGLSSKLGIETPLSNMPILGNFFPNY